MTTPRCTRCNRDARLTSGRELYPKRPELAEKAVWQCDGCFATVGCHPGTNQPLGTLAGPATRRARSALHAILDPLWQTAATSGEYPQDMPEAAKRAATGKARGRVYEYLADALQIARVDCHVASFDEEQCERAMKVLAGVTYGQIRDQARKREGKA